MIVYPGAVHGFDGPRSRGVYMGHQVGRDDTAAEAAIATTQQFLRERLMPGAG